MQLQEGMPHAGRTTLQNLEGGHDVIESTGGGEDTDMEMKASQTYKNGK